MTARSPGLSTWLQRAAATAALLAAMTASGAPAEDPASQQPAADEAAAPAKPKPPRPNYLEPLYAGEVIGVLGKNVVAPNGENLGLITDVIVGGDGRPRAAVIDFGGFLGVGSRKIAVDWNLLSFDTQKRDRAVVLTLDRREIQAAPEYKADAESAEMVGPPLVGPSSGGDVDK